MNVKSSILKNKHFFFFATKFFFFKCNIVELCKCSSFWFTYEYNIKEKNPAYFQLLIPRNNISVFLSLEKLFFTSGFFFFFSHSLNYSYEFSKRLFHYYFGIYFVFLTSMGFVVFPFHRSFLKEEEQQQ